MENFEKETIAAIATALSDSGIGIVRISGENAIYIVDSIFRSASGKKILTKVQSHMIHYGYIVDKDENIIDEVMTSVMKAPKSYTMEDTVEINCHGGVLVMQKVLETVLQAGARLAEPGEFTKRAFLNGRIDLSRAEAVIDVIHSQNEYALSSSVSQLKGRLSDKIRSLREDILYQIAFTVCPSNGPNPQSAITSVASCNTRSIRRSGLSLPYLSIDSRYGMRTNGALDAVLYTPYFSNTGGNTSSTTENTSSWEANAISISS